MEAEGEEANLSYIVHSGRFSFPCSLHSTLFPTVALDCGICVELFRSINWPQDVECLSHRGIALSGVARDPKMRKLKAI
jgi:hypothetical protein